MAKIVIDCDLVLAASDEAWLEWLYSVTSYKGLNPDFLVDNLHCKVNYDLTYYYKKELKKANRDGFDFWRSTTCYDHINPVPGSVEYVNRLNQLGHDIAVVSAVKGNHSKSKYQFLQRYYPDCIDAFIWTQEKNWIGCDYFIDDRNKFLNLANPTKAKFKLDTPYTQCEDLVLTDNTFVVESWIDIYLTILDLESKESNQK